jgi:hypothetical protein
VTVLTRWLCSLPIKGMRESDVSLPTGACFDLTRSHNIPLLGLRLACSTNGPRWLNCLSVRAVGARVDAPVCTRSPAVKRASCMRLVKAARPLNSIRMLSILSDTGRRSAGCSGSGATGRGFVGILSQTVSCGKMLATESPR